MVQNIGSVTYKSHNRVTRADIEPPPMWKGEQLVGRLLSHHPNLNGLFFLGFHLYYFMAIGRWIVWHLSCFTSSFAFQYWSGSTSSWHGSMILLSFSFSSISNLKTWQSEWIFHTLMFDAGSFQLLFLQQDPRHLLMFLKLYWICPPYSSLAMVCPHNGVSFSVVFWV